MCTIMNKPKQLCLISIPNVFLNLDSVGVSLFKYVHWLYYIIIIFWLYYIINDNDLLYFNT